MPLSNKNQIKGYVLEEVVSYLVRNSGYQILTPFSSNSDPDLLVIGDDIKVRGRGSTHQVDVLGELDIPLAFTFPLRIFVEAKCYEDRKVGLNIIRNAVGTIMDVNQNYLPRIEKEPRIKYHYSYVIFSTSGFSRNALDMAAAHQISIVDFSSQPFSALVSAIDNFSNFIAGSKNIEKVSTLRWLIRSLLNESDSTYLPLLTSLELQNKPVSGNGGTLSLNEYKQEFGKILGSFDIDKNGDYLFLGFSYGPFLLVMKAENRLKFLNFIKSHPKHNVNIHFNSNKVKIWYIEPQEHKDAYRLYFSLPEILGDWIFYNEEERLKRAREVKALIFSKLTIFLRDSEEDGHLIVAELVYGNLSNSYNEKFYDT
jgi:hypothetical protein